MSAVLAKYGVARTFRIPVIKRAAADVALTGDWTPAAGDVKVWKDGTAANVTTLPTALTSGGHTVWAFGLTATEMQAGEIVISVVDSATKAVEDQDLVINTCGHPSALFPFDFATAAVAIATGGITAASFAVGAIDNAAIATDAIGSAELAASAVGEIIAAMKAANGLPDAGACQSTGTTSTAVLASTASSVDDAYNGMIWIGLAGPAAGEPMLISDYVGATRTATFNGVLSTAPTAATRYAVLNN